MHLTLAVARLLALRPQRARVAQQLPFISHATTSTTMTSLPSMQLVEQGPVAVHITVWYVTEQRTLKQHYPNACHQFATESANVPESSTQFLTPSPLGRIRSRIFFNQVVVTNACQYLWVRLKTSADKSSGSKSLAGSDDTVPTTIRRTRGNSHATADGT
ncbi:hypothetical protein BC832DRAFT_408485 [Gaertneriomyces semiglobifer]|nr:hypothetical protein BC832DRAFT_408485 [Gaertneriomyces semiglobifer]